MFTDILQSARGCINRDQDADAESLCQQVLRTEPNNPAALNLLAQIALKGGNFERTIQIYKKVFSLGSESAVAHYNLGLAYLNTENANLAAVHFQKSLDLQPDLGCVYPDLCLALIRCNAIAAAIAAGKKGVSALPESPAAHYNLAQAYDAWKKHDLAFVHYQKAAAILPDHPGIQLSLATAYVGFGKREAAIECYNKVIELCPEDVEAYRQLTRIKKFTSTNHRHIIKLKSILSEPWLNDEDRPSVLFALGKAYQDCESYDEAFMYFQQANLLQETQNRFVPEELADYVTSIINTSDSELLNEKSTMGHSTNTPVFVVGVPRSGTSLVEQILASHPDIYGAGELDWIVNIANSMPAILNTTLPYPQCITKLDKPSINTLATGYLSYLRSLSPDAVKIVDKMPGNFLYLNLIHIFFPNAKIINCLRDSRDTCISMYTEYFPAAVPYSTNLVKLGAYYSQYERIMDYWRSVIPNHSLLDIEYENLVSNQEETSRQLIKFIGLPWKDDCMTFHQKQRRVNTASDLQVKKPIYTSSVGRWKHYQEYLQPLEQGFK